jgi:hypothetical protein
MLGGSESKTTKKGAKKEMAPGLEISLFSCDCSCYHVINAARLNPQIIHNFFQSKSTTHASHLDAQISLVLSPFIGQISYILMGDPSFVLDPSFYGIFAVSPPALLCTPRFTKTV